jgi:hypothetical protein
MFGSGATLWAVFVVPLMEPNKHGVYDAAAAERFVFTVKGKATCEIYILQVGDEWLCAVDSFFLLGDYSGSGEPLTRDRNPFYNRGAALEAGIGRALRHFHPLGRDGCATAEQVRVSMEMHSKLVVFLTSLGGVDLNAVPLGAQFSLFA